MQQRHDLYGPIHKALRKRACELLVQAGQADFAEDATRFGMIDAVRRHLDFISVHLWHEESFVHPALRARDAAVAAILEDQHASHGEAMRDTLRCLDALEGVSDAEAAQAGRALYLSLARLLAHDLAHMDHEETVVQPLLHHWFDDTALQGMMAAIIASMPHEELMEAMREMLPALSVDECARMVGGIRATLPAGIAEGFVPGVVQPMLAPDQYARLVEVLGERPRPVAPAAADDA